MTKKHFEIIEETLKRAFKEIDERDCDVKRAKNIITTAFIVRLQRSNEKFNPERFANEVFGK